MAKTSKNMSKTAIIQEINDKNSSGWSLWDCFQVPAIRILACNYYRNIGQWDYPRHSVPFWYLWRSEFPGGELIFNDQTIELKSGERVLIPPYTPFATRMSRSFSQFYIHFAIDDTDKCNLVPVARRPVLLPSDDAEMFFDNLHREDISIADIWLTAYSEVVRALHDIPGESILSPGEPAMDPRIMAALDFMSRSPGATPANAEIARRVGMSETNFLRLFRLEMKDSPRQYMLRLHLNYCQELLKNSTLSLDDIAAAGGFADRYHFSKAFRKVYNTSPGRFRRNIRDKFSD